MNKLEKRYDEVSTLINTIEILIDNTTYKDILIDLESLKHYYLDELSILEDELFFKYTKKSKVIKKLYESLIF
ncbi:MAG: hypothetical protein IIZ40_01435 [Bacilli bacterium]|nr:hypothetical protein [Bacilli bacterium]